MTKKLNIPFSPPDITEEEIQAVAEVMRSGWITTGPKTKQFEKEIAAYCHTQKAVCMNSATACLEMTLRLFGIGEGDEVIVPAYTYTASASVVCHVGATLKLVDCAPGSFHLDYDALEQAVTEKTKAIIPVDIAGVMVDYDRIRALAERKKALFHPASPLQEALGRILILADSAHGFGAKRNGKMSGECAKLPVEALTHFDDTVTSSGHLYLVRLTGKGEEYRNDMITRMAENGVACNVHFKPLPMHTAYKNLGFHIEDFPNAYEMYHNEITLPLHTCLTDEQADYVIDTFCSLVK